MKALVAVLSLLVAQSVYADMMVECSNANGSIKATYISQNIAGQPSFTYMHQISSTGKQLNLTANASDVRRESTVLGTVVSMKHSEASSPDNQDVYVGLVVPDIHLDDANMSEVEFKTQAIETVSRTSIAGPDGVQGVVQATDYYP